MRGDQNDFVARLRLTLPQGWFGDVAPVLGGVIAGIGAAWVTLYDLLQAVRGEARLATASGQLLDLACADFFGGGLTRSTLETDAALRARLHVAMQRLRGTRASLIDAAAGVGYIATVFEPARPADTGGYNMSSGLAWGVAGGWGSLQMPMECFITVRSNGAVSDAAAAVSVALPAGGIGWIRAAD